MKSIGEKPPVGERSSHLTAIGETWEIRGQQFVQRARARLRERFGGKSGLGRRALHSFDVHLGKDRSGMIAQHSASDQPRQFLALLDYGRAPALRALIRLMQPFQDKKQVAL